ncbi:hypothetical protein [Desulfosoma caldarium]|uniref:Uncharacterized protein n=1 Tax=Desulfosoma caldarium TaxID=610254 RepID=A0A3N1ULJ4_9BACT|nr:hypothetical protein [Desulfosoma caldarium]ROQ89570.1 hypothetical protein EDC27_3106 [Desulfosoma caldarium]
MQRRLFAFMLVLGCVLAAISASAQVDYPNDIKSAVTQYPGSQVEMAMKTPQGSQVVLSSTDPSPKVYAYYKQALSQSGWETQMEMNHAEGIQGHWRKGDKVFHVVVTKDEEKTQIVLILGTGQ